MLTNAKVGDVLVVGYHNFGYDRLETVTRVTRMRVFCGGISYTRSGVTRPKNYGATFHAKIASPADIARIHEESERREYIRVICDAANPTVLQRLDTLTLRRLVHLLKTTETKEVSCNDKP